MADNDQVVRCVDLLILNAATGRVFILNKDGRWILPGDTRRSGETDYACLYRIAGEQVPALDMNVSLAFYVDDFTGMVPRFNREGSARMYMLVGSWQEPTMLGTGLSGATWVNPRDVRDQDLPFHDMTRRMIEKARTLEFA